MTVKEPRQSLWANGAASALLSPSTSARDRVTKRTLYAKLRSRALLAGRCRRPVLEAFSLVKGNWVLTGSFDDTAHARIAPFEEVELPVGRLFLPVEAEPG